MKLNVHNGLSLSLSLSQLPGVKPSFLVHTSIRSPCSSQKSENIHPKPPPPPPPQPQLFIDPTFILTEVIHEAGYWM